MAEDGRLVDAYEQYERAVFGGAADAVDLGHRALDGVEADVSLARGRLIHAKFLADRELDSRELGLFVRAAKLYKELGDERREAEALFWIGTYHQVCDDDQDKGRPFHERSYELAVRTGDRLTQSYAVRHLGFSDLAAGRVDQARAHLEESVRLRRELDFQPGVAAGVLALAQLEIETGDKETGMRQLDEATAIARSSGADRILHWIDQVRSSI